MNVEILIHGVPDGQDYYGIAEERTYAELFYDNSAESVKFVVETKTTGNNASVYYTYLRYKGMVGYGGRPGSYFGLTLRIDKYYQDVIHMYNMLEMVFKKYVVGVLLAPLAESYKYTVPNFASKKAEIEQLQQGLAQLIQGTCAWSKFVDVDKSFIHPDAAAASCNIADITENTMTAALKKYSKVVLSPDYKLNLAKEYEKKIQEVEGKGGGLVAEKEKKLVEKEEEIGKLKATISSQKNQIEALQTTVRQKETEILQNKKNSQLSQMISGIKEPINSLAEYFHVHDSQKNPPKPSYGLKNFIIGIAGCLLSAIVIALLLFAKPQKGADTKPLENQIAELSKANSLLTEEIASKDNTIADLRVQLANNQPGQQPNTTTPPTVKVKNLRIDIDPYKAGDLLDCETAYTIRVKETDGAKAEYSGNGKWTIKNAEITQGKNTDSKITIKPNGKGSVEIAYQSENCTCSPRSFPVKKQSADPKFEIVTPQNLSEVEVGQEYTFSISGYEGKGTWRLDGFDTNDDKSGRQIKVTANANGSGGKATISYTPEGGTKKSKSFKYKANE